MKKMISLLAAVIFVFVLGTTAFAADYYVDEADMHISLPYDYDVIKPGMDKDVYNSFGYGDSYEDIMKILKEEEMYLYALSWDGSSYVKIDIIDYGMDYANCTEAELNEEMDFIYESFVSSGYKVLEKEIVSTGSNKLIRLVFIDSANDYDITYVASDDENMVFVEYIVSPEAYNDEFIAMAADSVESIIFGDVADAKEPVKEHFIPEIGAYVSLPDKYYVMTSEGYDDWFNENQTEEDIQDLLDMNAEDNRFLAAIGDDVSHDISVYVDEAEPGYETEKEFFEFADEYYFGNNVIVQEKEIVKIDGTNYIYIRIKEKDDFTCASMYAALKDGKYICYLCNISSGELTERLENELYSIVESTRYEAPGATEPESVPEATEPTVITDELLGFSMTVPEKWFAEESQIETDGDVHSYAFYPTENYGVIISCAAMSVKAFASDMTFGQVELTEDAFENLTLKDYAEIFKVPEEDITVKELGGNTYYLAEQEVSGMPTTGAIIVKNGVYYTFMYGGLYGNIDKAPTYPVFEEFLANVEYTEPTICSDGAGPTETAKLAKTVGTVLIVFIVLGIAVIGIIIAVIIIAVKKSKKKKQEAAFVSVTPQPMIQPQQGEIPASAENSIAPEEESAAPKEEIPAPAEEISEPAENNFCTSCGAKLTEDSRFCPKCGTPVNKE